MYRVSSSVGDLSDGTWQLASTTQVTLSMNLSSLPGSPAATMNHVSSCGSNSHKITDLTLTQ
ncbi:hypothetical protein E2C01_017873 [Portunus trituberculatus]|uniref:Uncharacterized protein n=1 Tax=Portunus trituberculatus TaxID=210409 RepID=A0A5B7DUQ1_PORTR|nr:hypothetical protein [Portunus trituberculatus]